MLHSRRKISNRTASKHTAGMRCHPHAKTAVKRDGPVFFFPSADNLTRNEKTFFDHRSLDAWSLALGIGCFCPFLPSCFPYFISANSVILSKKHEND